MNSTAKYIVEEAAVRGLLLTTAESCTGGMVAAALTDVPGASAVFEQGYVTYSNRAKTALLGVPETLLAAHGAVSEQVARAMAEGALQHAQADISVAITGIAGPGGGSPEKPVGLVFIATARKGGNTLCEQHNFSGSRAKIRQAATEMALIHLLQRIQE